MYLENAHRVYMRNRNTNVAKMKRESKDMFIGDKTIKNDENMAINKHNTQNVDEKHIEESINMLDKICQVDYDSSYVSDEPLLIVTLTSWPRRIFYVADTLKSILNNTIQPDKIIINLSTEEFIHKENDLPSGLINLMNEHKNIEIHWLKNNTTVWKKIIPTMMRFKQSKIICIDDDKLYYDKFIQDLYEESENNPNNPITGTHSSFYKDLKQHRGCASLDKYEFYSAGIHLINDKILSKKSSDSYFTILSNKCGHPTVSCKLGPIKSLEVQDDGYSKIEVKYPVGKILPDLDAIVRIEKNVKIALCAIAKKENLYIREWVEYYKNLGIDKIFLYDNNEIDGEDFYDVIPDYIDSDYVKLINKRGIEKGLVFDNNGINLQTSCYIDCYENLCNEFDWVCFFDIDEFLEIKNGDKLSNFLCEPRFDDCGSIAIPWVHYSDNDLIYYDNRPVFERFNKKSRTKRNGCKSIVRTRYETINQTTQNLIHSFVLKGKQHIYPTGDVAISVDEQKTLQSGWITCRDKIVEKSNLVLRHYKTKTLEEYLYRHLGRHWGTSKKMTQNERTIDDCYRDFFNYNNVSNDKIKVFNEKTANNFAQKYNDYLKLVSYEH